MKKLNMRSFVAIAMLSSLSFVLMFIKFPVLPAFSFLTVDFSDIPAIIAALLFGPIGAVIVELIKNLLDYLFQGVFTGVPIGNFANFVAGLLFVLPTYYVYIHMKSKLGMTIALIVGTLSMTILMSILNYFIILPAYIALIDLKVPSIKDYIVQGILPFNFIKGILVAIIFTLLFTRLQSWITKQTAIKN